MRCGRSANLWAIAESNTEDKSLNRKQWDLLLEAFFHDKYLRIGPVFQESPERWLAILRRRLSWRIVMSSGIVQNPPGRFKLPMRHLYVSATSSLVSYRIILVLKRTSRPLLEDPLLVQCTLYDTNQ